MLHIHILVYISLSIYIYIYINYTTRTSADCSGHFRWTCQVLQVQLYLAG